MALCGQDTTKRAAEIFVNRRLNRKQDMMMADTTEVNRRSLMQSRIQQGFYSTSRFAKSDQEKERELHGKKWFDYRFISPMAATARFHCLYQDVYRRKYAANFDTFEAERKTGVSKKGTRAGLTSFWRVRQFADELGVTYEIFLEAAFQVFIRRGWTRLPHVNQLYGMNREAIVNSVKSLWAEHIADRFSISTLPQYREERYIGLNAQVDHRNWVREQIKGDHGAPFNIGRACFIHRVLPESTALLDFGQERLAKARAEIEFDGIAPDELGADEPSLPSCFGLPGAPDAGCDQCQACSAFRPCLKMETLIRNAVAKKFGSDDPVLSRQKAKGRMRTAKHRAKNALKSG